MFHVQPENVISGIFIKQVLEDSPAGKNGTLKTGDRILEVSSWHILYINLLELVVLLTHNVQEMVL